MALPTQPNIQFVFPYRWLKEDREFLGQNLHNMTIRQIGNPDEELDNVFAYKAVISYQYKDPLSMPFTKTDAQKVFKKIFPSGRCMSVAYKYTQSESKTMLPMCEMQLYF